MKADTGRCTFLTLGTTCDLFIFRKRNAAAPYFSKALMPPQTPQALSVLTPPTPPNLLSLQTQTLANLATQHYPAALPVPPRLLAEVPRAISLPGLPDDCPSSAQSSPTQGGYPTVPAFSLSPSFPSPPSFSYFQ